MAKVGRPKQKADARIFRLRKDLDKFLCDRARKRGVPMTRVLEDLLENARLMKDAA